MLHRKLLILKNPKHIMKRNVIFSQQGRFSIGCKSTNIILVICSLKNKKNNSTIHLFVYFVI